MRGLVHTRGVIAASLVLGLWAGDASAHGSIPAVAFVNDPIGVGTVVDDSMTFTWVDFDKPIPTGTATVDFHYTSRRPPAFQPGEIHPLLHGDVIVQGIIEKDLDNTYTWDTSGVPAGSYFIWSIVIEPPEEMMAPQVISFSPGVLTIAHPGDEIAPALLLTSPQSPFQFADETFDVLWEAFDPDGTGRVKVEVGTSSMGVGYEVIADDLDPAGTFVWDTSEVAEGDWYVRATITDARGLSFTTYAEYLLLVSHVAPEPDAGVVDSGAPTPDAAVTADAGGPEPEANDGCICLTPSSGRVQVGLPLLFGGLLTARRRRRTSTRVRR